MSIFEDLVKNKKKMSLVGLGYVGMPIAVAFAKKGIDVIGFDLNKLVKLVTRQYKKQRLSLHPTKKSLEMPNFI